MKRYNKFIFILFVTAILSGIATSLEAQDMSALRHADAGAAAKAVEGYASILLALQEAR